MSIEEASEPHERNSESGTRELLSPSLRSAKRWSACVSAGHRESQRARAELTWHCSRRGRSS
jgi:hypothetical protein